MDKNKTRLLIAIALAGAAAGCSSDETTEHPQPAASMGDEVTPAEITTETQPQAAPEANVPAEETPLAAAQESATIPGDTSATESLRDGQIAKITDLVNSSEIEQAQLARSKATQPRVKKFAADLMAQHQKAKQAGVKLTKASNITPEESAVAGDLETKSAQTLSMLKSSDAASFDMAYLTAQVQQHQEVLDMLNEKLIPSATDSKLKAELEDTRSMVEHHLEEAQEISRALSAGT